MAYPALGLAMVASAGLVDVMAAPSAHAWNSLGCKWNHKKIHYYVPAPLLSSPIWTGAAAGWAGLDATLTYTSSNVDYYATNENRGNTVTWTGVTRSKGTIQTPPPCSGGYWTSGKMEVVINWSYVEKLGYGDPKKKMVAAHEMGHAFGLAHTPNHPEWLMYNYDTRTTKVPAANDRSGVNALY